MSEYKYKGYDISEAQVYSHLDIADLIAADADFIIIRAGISQREDKNLYHNIYAASGKVAFGLYWYLCALTESEARQEAEACIRIASRYPAPNLPIFADIETNEQCKLDADTKAKIIKVFCETIEKAGYTAGIYTFWGFLEGIKKQYSQYLTKYPLWLAAWTECPEIVSSGVKAFNPIIWQWGLDNIKGIGIDGNRSRIDFAIECTPTPEPEKPEGIKIGDKVKVRPGAAFSDGKQPVSWVYKTEFIVYNISRDDTEALIGIDGKYTGWVYVSDLILTSSGNKNPQASAQKIDVGDAVKVKAGATTYDGKPLASFVYTLVYTVMQVGSGSRDDYIVIGDGKNVTAAVKAEDIIVVL